MPIAIWFSKTVSTVCTSSGLQLMITTTSVLYLERLLKLFRYRKYLIQNPKKNPPRRKIKPQMMGPHVHRKPHITPKRERQVARIVGKSNIVCPSERWRLSNNILSLSILFKGIAQILFCSIPFCSRSVIASSKKLECSKDAITYTNFSPPYTGISKSTD